MRGRAFYVKGSGMFWIVLYRRNDGKQIEECVEAASRADLFLILKTRGISPVRIVETKTKRSRLKFNSHLAVWCGLSIGVVALVWILVQLRSGTSALRDAQTSKATGEPVITEPLALPKNINTLDNSVALHTNHATRAENELEVVSSSITTNNSGAIIERLTLSNGKKIKKVHPPKPIFNNASDQVIAMAVNAKPGQALPPFPNLDKSLEQDFIESLASPIVINDDDPEDVKELKAIVKETKAYIVREIKNGGSLLDILAQHQNESEKIADSHLMAVQEMQKIRDEIGEAAAKEFIREVNESFKIRGIPEIEFKSTEDKK